MNNIEGKFQGPVKKLPENAPNFACDAKDC
jgi:hypothetical protein